jgi:Queuosine biosynthesis protein
MLSSSASGAFLNSDDTLLAAYDYVLPPTLIAQSPANPRDSSRLLVVEGNGFQHHSFRDITQQLQPGDLLVLNNTRVIPARLIGRKVNPVGFDLPAIAVEVFLLEPRGDRLWLALVKPGRRLKPGAIIEFGGDSGKPLLRARVMETDAETRGRLIEFDLEANQAFEPILAVLGEVPLPPYIDSAHSDPEQYQTVFATTPGAVAAPTAGLHFTPRSGHPSGLRDAACGHRHVSACGVRAHYGPCHAFRMGRDTSGNRGADSRNPRAGRSHYCSRHHRSAIAGRGGHATGTPSALPWQGEFIYLSRLPMESGGRANYELSSTAL